MLLACYCSETVTSSIDYTKNVFVRDVLFKHLHGSVFIVIRTTAMTVMLCKVFKFSWEVDIYELESCNYVWCNQVTLVGAI